MVSLSIEEASLSEGLRAACAATTMLLIGKFFHNPLFAWAAIGAFWTCLSDAAGSSRRRFASMVGFSLLSTVLGGLAACASSAGTIVAAITILILSSAAGLACIWTAAAYQVAILVATACVVMVDKPLHGVHDGSALLGIYFCGCLFATVLSFTIWRIHPFAPGRYATRLVYCRLTELARDTARLIGSDAIDDDEWSRQATDLRARTRMAIDATRIALTAVPRAKSEGRRVYDDLSLALANAENIFDFLIAVASVGERGHYSSNHSRRAARCLSAIAEVLLRMGRRLGDRESGFPHDLWRCLPLFARRLEFALKPALPPGLLAMSAAPLGNRIALAPDVDHWFDAARQTTRWSWDILKVQMSPGSVGLRHAARLGTATTAAFVVVRLLHLPFGYWATMATLLILQPSIATTWLRGIERAAGSTVGAALAVFICFLVHTPLTISLVIFPLVCLTMAVRRVNYSLYVIFLTPTFVLVAHFASPAKEFTYALERLSNNILGCLIALIAAYVLWPERAGESPADTLAGTVKISVSDRHEIDSETLRR
jgi:uncharacterized membrane protein YccC